MDPAHPQAGTGPLALKDYLRLDHIDITYEGRWRSRYLAELEALGHRLDARLAVPSPAGVPSLIAGTRLVATLPRRLAAAIGDRLALRDCPVPGRFSVAMVWPQRHHRDVMHRWLRDQVVEAVRLPDGPGA